MGHFFCGLDRLDLGYPLWPKGDPPGVMGQDDWGFRISDFGLRIGDFEILVLRFERFPESYELI